MNKELWEKENQIREEMGRLVIYPDHWAYHVLFYRAYTAETQVEYKLGKEINPDGLRKFGEYLEWDIFNFQAKSAVSFAQDTFTKKRWFGFWIL